MEEVKKNQKWDRDANLNLTALNSTLDQTKLEDKSGFNLSSLDLTFEEYRKSMPCQEAEMEEVREGAPTQVFNWEEFELVRDKESIQQLKDACEVLKDLRKHL